MIFFFDIFRVIIMSKRVRNQTSNGRSKIVKRASTAHKSSYFGNFFLLISTILYFNLDLANEHTIKNAAYQSFIDHYQLNIGMFEIEC